MEVIQLLGSVLGLAFVAGINLYATVLTVGLGIQFGFIHPSAHLPTLSILSHPYVLTAAAIAYTMEFFADKIPWVDNLWDSFHTFIRPVGAALIGMKAVGTVDPGAELAILLLCGGMAFVSHSSKASIRLVANHSPEPFSNIALSLAEDVSVVGGSWVALQYPTVMLGADIIFVTVFLFFAPKVFRLFRLEMLAISALLSTMFSPQDGSDDSLLSDEVPDRFFEQMREDSSGENELLFCVRCASGKGACVERNCMGFLYLAGQNLFFITRKHFRIRKVAFHLSKISDLKFYRKRLLDRLSFGYEGGRTHFLLLKKRQNRGERLTEILKTVQRT